MSFMPKKMMIVARDRKARAAASFLYIPNRRVSPRIISKMPWSVRNISLEIRGSVSIHVGTNPIHADGFKGSLFLRI